MTTETARAVFLDRDGVLNDVLYENGRPRSPRSLEEFRIVPAAREALSRLREAGFLLIVVTNQPEVVRGYQTRTTVELMHRRLAEVLPLDEIRTCFHDVEHACSCRKPKPGMLMEAARAWKLELAESFLVGDRDKDIAAGREAGCRTVLMKCEYNRLSEGDPDMRASTLDEAADVILAASARSRRGWGPGDAAARVRAGAA